MKKAQWIKTLLDWWKEVKEDFGIAVYQILNTNYKDSEFFIEVEDGEIELVEVPIIRMKGIDILDFNGMYIHHEF